MFWVFKMVPLILNSVIKVRAKSFVIQDHNLDKICQDQGHYILFLLFFTKNFYIKMKLRGTTSNDFELDKCYSEYDSEIQ